MRDPVYTSELDHDSGVKLTKHDLEEALDDLIDRLFEGRSVNGWFLMDYVEKFKEEIAAHVISGGGRIDILLDNLVRRDLMDSDAVRERAAELAQEGE